jgi:molybdopterin molybdotransferase
MGAPDKGLLVVGGETMVGRAARRLREAAATVIVSANGDPARFAALGVPVVADDGLAGGEGALAGPLAGILAGMDWTARNRPDARFLLTLPSDTPLLPEGVAEALIDAAGEGGGAAIVVAASDAGRHPVVALWPLGLRDEIRAALAAGKRKIGAFLDAHPTREVRFPPLRIGGELVDPFLNVNTPADLAAAEALLAAEDAPATTGRLADDCFAPSSSLMTHDAAIALITARAPAVARPMDALLDEALERVLAEVVVAPRDVPLADNSAVDGYAFHADDHAATGGFMPVVDTVLAGRTDAGPVPPGAAVRIYTGAAMPAGVDTVAMQEDCDTHRQDGTDFVIIPAGLKTGANRRRAGEDVTAGSEIMQPGLRLRPQDLAALASIGRTSVTVRRPLRVAVASTGDEVIRPGAPLVAGQIYDANHALVAALVTAAGGIVTDLGVIPDDRAAVERAIDAAARAHDLLITSGGVSNGEADHVGAALDALGRRHIWTIAVKPGKPLTFGQVGDCAMLGLPGNPVAAFAGFLLYGLPLMAGLEGATWRPPRRWKVPAGFNVESRRTGRREFPRGILVDRPDGTLAVERYASDGSSLITGLRIANGFIDIAEDVSSIRVGEPVDFLPFSSFGLAGLN